MLTLITSTGTTSAAPLPTAEPEPQEGNVSLKSKKRSQHPLFNKRMKSVDRCHLSHSLLPERNVISSEGHPGNHLKTTQMLLPILETGN